MDAIIKDKVQPFHSHSFSLLSSYPHTLCFFPGVDTARRPLPGENRDPQMETLNSPASYEPVGPCWLSVFQTEIVC